MALIQLLFFHSSGLRLALDLAAVERILPAPLLGQAAGAPGFIEGFLDYQNRAVAALRLDRLLGETDDQIGLYAPLILLKEQEPPIALHVARVDGVLPMPAETIQPLGSGETFNGCVAGRLSDADGTVYLIRAEGLLLAAERARLSAFAAIQQARLDALVEASHAA